MDNRGSSEQARIARKLLRSLEAELSALIERRDPNSAGIAHEMQKTIDDIRAADASETSGHFNVPFHPFLPLDR